MENKFLTHPSQHPLNRVVRAYNRVAASDRKAAALDRAAERAEAGFESDYLSDRWATT